MLRHSESLLILKIVPKASYDMYCSIAGTVKNYEAAFGTIFRNCKCSQQNITFIMTRQSKWFETICTCTEITDLVLKDFKKYASHDPVPILDPLCAVAGSRDM
jgi:hypothetical protein